jgi:hypothetical protein
MEMKSVNVNAETSFALPTEFEPWPRKHNFFIGPDNDQDDISQAEVRHYTANKMWTWAGRTVYFFCDIHADADAFFLSLEACGSIVRTGAADDQFELSEAGRSARFIIGGDCFDKGPHNLRLLEAIHQLYIKGADIELLAGNHDIRTYLGIYYAESKEPLLDHLFVRMGKKTVPLLKEIYDIYIRGNHDQQLLLEDPSIKSLLYPSESWYEEFPKAAKKWVPEIKLQKELRRIREKSTEFEERVEGFGMDLMSVYAAVKKFRELFFEPDGRYHWFFDKMKLAHREGSYLFVHAGLDDVVANTLYEHGVDHLNQEFSDLIHSDPFEVYHGVLGNVFRTKYREFDYDFTSEGMDKLHRAGIYAIVHGHRNILQGQRLVIREGMLNFECDASVDCNTRDVENLYGPGAGVVIFDPRGFVQGVSTDYPYIKSFHPGNITVASLS